MVVGIEGTDAGGHQALHEEKVLRCSTAQPGKGLVSYLEHPHLWVAAMTKGE